ncbi:MAG: hypothetical protein IRZ32_14525, partial [Solirubrobacteraceae bacterium]|nr:hypothetical protein [Solirubrobacteraceae bacterium]
AVLGLAAALAATPAVAVARLDDEREREVRCSQGSRAELKAERDDGRLEVELEVDQGRRGVTWTVQIRRNGTRVVATRATTRGRSGSFSVERRIADRGTNRIVARATSPSGEVCRVRVTI